MQPVNARLPRRNQGHTGLCLRCSDVGAVLGVVEGRGHAEFGEQEVALQERDLIVVPS